jgi:D-alanyl-D-alanine carboxypeptidase
MASVGKLFTAVLVAMLKEQGKLAFEDPIADYLEPDLLDRLHVYKGQDYSRQIRIRHLLNHTSGLHDYFEDRPAQGEGMVKRLLDQPGREYTPREVIRWSAENLKAHFPPGKGFHYSDTGYHLLGLIVEAVAALPFHAALRGCIFEPLEMSGAFLIGHSQPQETSPHPVAGVYVQHTNIVRYRSLSIDYAGGGVTAPLEELLKFMQALVQGRLISAETFRQMDDCAKFSTGMDYGYGMMKIRTVPIIMPERFNCWGNAGSTGAFMFYHPGQDATLIGSLNQFRYAAKGIRFMLQAIDKLIRNG